MKNTSSAALRRRRHQLVRTLPPIKQVIRGSLIETHKRCGRPNCHCIDGPGHGPKRYLSTVARTGERPRLGYVPNATYPKSLRSHQLPQTTGDAQRVCAINAELLRRRESLRLNGSGCRNARFCQGGRHHRQHDRILSRCRRPAVQCGRSRSCRIRRLPIII